MRKPTSYLRLSLAALVLSGCSTLEVTENNSSSYDTWELCTLLYRPHQIFPDWVADEKENKTIAAELEKRGIYDEKSCTVMDLAKRECLEFGYKKDTESFAECTRKSFRDINDKIINTKQDKNKEKYSGSSSFWVTTSPYIPICTTSVLTGTVTCF